MGAQDGQNGPFSFISGFFTITSLQPGRAAFNFRLIYAPLHPCVVLAGTRKRKMLQIRF